MHVVRQVVIYPCDNNIWAAVTDAGETSASVDGLRKHSSNSGATRWRHPQALIGFLFMTDKTLN